MKTPLSKNALFTYFQGHATPLQKTVIREWLSDPRNAEQYYEWLEEWEREHPQFIPDTEKALGQFLNRLDQRDGAETYASTLGRETTRRSFAWVGYAAAVVVLLALAAGYWGKDLIRYKEYTTGYGELMAIELSDGSHVTLNSHSTLRVPRFGFGTETRQVFLNGEAEFSVTHTKDDKKFQVRTPDALEVEVLGTKFLVYSRKRGSKVVLTEGKVLLRSLSDTAKHTLAMRPGEVVTIQQGAFKVKEEQPVEAHVAWKEHRFVFDHTSLQEIAFQVEESFGLKMQIGDSLLAKRMLTGTYEAENADELLDVLARVLDVRVSRSNEKIVVQPR